jgi:two-component system, NarL family, sensor histidine kinase DesK
MIGLDSEPTTAVRRAYEQPMTSTVAPNASLRKMLPRMWQLFVGAWLFFLLVAVGAELRANFSVGRLLALGLWTTVFVALWLWLMLRNPFRAAEPEPAERQLQIGLIIALFALVTYFNLVYGPGLSWLYIYVQFAIGITLPTRAAVQAIILVTLAAAALDVATGRWSDALQQVPGVAVYGFIMVIVRRLVVTVRELDEAREEIVHLAASEAVAAERLRFARDLHDLIGHSLSLITLKSELAGRLLPGDPDRAATEIADVERVARQSLREVREAVAGYRQPGLSAELAAARELLAAAGIDANIDATADLLPPAIDGVLAWTVREGVTNVIRHSRARHCEIRITHDDGTIRAEVTDDGPGGLATLPPETSGSGLSGLAERIAVQGGHLATSARDGDGFTLSVTLPLPAEPSAERAQAR